jgi:hypothetical protein
MTVAKFAPLKTKNIAVGLPCKVQTNCIPLPISLRKSFAREL